MLVLNHANILEKTKTTAAKDNAHLQLNFMSAIYNAYAQTFATKGMKVEILMETGSHYIMPYEVSGYLNALKNVIWPDTINPEFDLIVRPVTCVNIKEMNAGSTPIIVYESPSCLDLVNPDATGFREVLMYNKAGSNFYMQVPTSLRWEGIIFDALDSYIHTSYINSFYWANNCFWIKN
jgi:hypothetical protein